MRATSKAFLLGAVAACLLAATAWVTTADNGIPVSFVDDGEPLAVQAVPPNDRCTNAERVEIGSVVSGETLGATVDHALTCPVDQGPPAT